MITVIDYKVGNLGSIENMLKKVGVEARISARPEDIQNANALILPGVGRFDYAMKALKSSGLIPVIEEKVFSVGTPLLGICVGLQLMCKESEEGNCEGLGWFDARVSKFQLQDPNLRVPHMGWNFIKVEQPNPLFEKSNPDHRYYFAHSFHVEAKDPEDVLASTEYGKKFHSALRRKNIFGVQFHPEKSHRHGLELLKRFSELGTT